MALAGQEGVDAVLGGSALLETLERLGVAGDMRGELRVEAEGHDDRDGHDQSSERLPDPGCPGPHRAQGHSPLRADRKEQEDDARAERIGERHEDALEREALRRGEHGDRRDHRARAGREEQAEADAEEEAASHSSGVAPTERLERPLDDGAEPRPEQRNPDEQNDRDGDVAEQVVREAERREERGRDQGEEREAPDEPGDDRVRPPPVAGGPAREDDRQDRQDARRDRGDDARDERNSDEQAHALIVDPRSEFFLTRAAA